MKINKYNVIIFLVALILILIQVYNAFLYFYIDINPDGGGPNDIVWLLMIPMFFVDPIIKYIWYILAVLFAGTIWVNTRNIFFAFIPIVLVVIYHVDYYLISRIPGFILGENNLISFLFYFLTPFLSIVLLIISFLIIRNFKINS